MSCGKYSPTISASYAFDQKWWERNGGGYGNGKNPDSDNDDDGYDSYGYANGNGPDRAGRHEDDYLSGEWIPAFDDDSEDYYHYPLYEDVSSEWAGRLLGDLPKFCRVEYQRLYLEYIKFDNIRYIFRGTTLYVHEDDHHIFSERNAKWLKTIA